MSSEKQGAAQVRTYDVQICDACIALNGAMCHTPECVFCRCTMPEVAAMLSQLLIRPIVDGEQVFSVKDAIALAHLRPEAVRGLVEAVEQLLHARSMTTVAHITALETALSEVKAELAALRGALYRISDSPLASDADHDDYPERALDAARNIAIAALQPGARPAAPTPAKED